MYNSMRALAPVAFALALALSLSGAATAFADDVAPVNATAPSLSGSELLGHQLAVDHGSWTGTPTITYAYQWRRCDSHGDACADIDQAIDTTYRLADADVGATLRVVVTAANAAGATSTVTTASDVVGTGEAAADAPDTATRYEYDLAGRLRTVVGHDASAVPGDPLQSAVYHWDAVGNLLSIERRDGAAPVIDELDRSSGLPGTKVVISGTGFSKHISQDTVKFAGTEAHVLDASTTKLVVVVPSGAADGAVTVTAPGGTATSPEGFDATSDRSPHITGISPTIIASPNLWQSEGDVTVTGSHFAPRLSDNVAYVNGRRAQLMSVSPTQLVIDPPPGTNGGRVSVTTPDGSDTGPDLYEMPVGVGAQDVDETQRTTVGTPTQVAVTAAYKKSDLLFDGRMGEQVSIDAAEVSGYASIDVYSPDGDKVGSFSAYENSQNFLDTITLPTDGTYSIVYQAVYFSGNGAHAKLTVHEVNNTFVDLQPTKEGATAHLTTAIAGDNPGIHMNLTAGQAIAFKAANSTVGYAAMRLYGPDGQEEAVSPAFWGDSGWWDSTTIPTTGQWTLRVDPNGTNTGSLDVTAYDATPKTVTVTPDDDGDTGHATTDVPGQDVVFNFHGTANQRISFKSTDDTTVRDGWIHMTLLTPGGAALSSYWWITDFGTPVRLPADGDYKIVVDPDNPISGVIGMTVYNVPDDLDQTATPTTSGSTPTSVRLPAPGQVANVHVHAEAGQKISVLATNLAMPYVTLQWLRADGTPLDYGYNYSNQAFWFGPTRFDASGDYILRVTPSNQGSGSVDLSFYDSTDTAPGSVTPTAAGATTTMTATVPGQTPSFTFTGRAGERLGSTTGDDTFGGAVWAWAALYAPDGSSVGWLPSGANSYGNPITLPADGTYTVVLRPQMGDHGSLQMTLYDVPADLSANVTPTFAGDTATFQLTPFQSASAHIAAHAGDKYSAMITSSASVWAFWQGASGNRWLYAPGGFLDQTTVPADGDVSVLAATQQGQAPGATTIKVYDAADIVRDLGSAGGSTHLDMSTPGANARVTFSGQAGDVVHVDFPNLTAGWFNQYLFEPDGQQIGFPWGGSSNLTLPQTGQYTIVLDPMYETTGSSDVSVTPQNGGASSARARAVKGATRKGVKIDPKRGEAAKYPTLKAYEAGVKRRGRVALPATGVLKKAKAPRVAAAATLAEAFVAGEQKRSGKEAAAKAKAEKAQRAAAARPVLSPRMRKPNGEPEIWRPQRSDRQRGGWVTGRQASPWAGIAMLQGGLGVTAVSGQTLKLNGMPLKGVRVSVVGADPVTTTDAAGRFVLTGIPAGKHTLRIEGSAASKGKRRYGDYEMVETFKANVTTELTDTVWMTRLDAAGDRRIASPTTKAIKMTNPKIPGFEVRIPAGSRVTDRQGKVLHHLNLSAVPLDRPPFALPRGVTVSAYFTVQPGGAYFSKGAQIVYPNYHHLPPKQRVTFWDYDAKDRGWFEYGKGHVTANGKQIVPDPGVRVWKLSGAMAATNPGPAWKHTRKGVDPSGDPVDPFSGLFAYTKADISISGPMPLTLTRTYNPVDSNAYEAGVGFSTIFDTRLVFDPDNSSKVKLITQGAQETRFKEDPSATDGPNETYRPYQSPGWGGTVVKYRTDTGMWRLVRPDGSGMEFDLGSPVTAIVSASGQRITIKRGYRNIIGSVDQVNFPDGRWLLITNGGITDSSGRRVTYTEDSNRRLTDVTDAAGHTTHYDYGTGSGPETGKLTAITDGRGHTFLRNEYGQGNVITKQTLANEGTFQFQYVCVPRAKWLDGAAGGGGGDSGGGGGGGGVGGGPAMSPGIMMAESAHKTDGIDPEDTADELAANGPCGDDPYLYTLIKNPNGSLTRVDWNHDGGWTETSPKGTMTEKLDGAYRLKQLIVDGVTTTYSYGTDDNVLATQTQYGNGPSWGNVYGYAGTDLMSIRDASGHTTTIDRDAKHRVIAVTDPTYRKTTYGYSGSDPRPTRITAPGGGTLRATYSNGDLATATDELGNTTTVSSDAAGWPIKFTDPLGHSALVSYDDDGEVTSVTDPKGLTTSFDYDANGNMTKLTDARGKSIEATYDDMDNIVSSTDQDGAERHFTRDLDGNITQEIDRRGQRTVMQYTGADQLKFVGYGAHDDGSGGQAYDATERITYNDRGAIAKVEDSQDGTIELSYDDLGDLTGVTQDGDTIAYDYDAAGRRTKMTLADGTEVSYAYDDAGRVTSITRGSVTATFSYDAAGRQTGTTLPGGVAQTDDLDAAGRLLSRHYAMGNAPGATVNYAYDATGQPIASWGSLDTTTLPAAQATATFDPANRVIARGGVNYSYDAEGNLTGDGSRTFTWDARNRLTKVTHGGVDTSYGYDALGRHDVTTTGGSTTTSVFDGWSAVSSVTGSNPATQILNGASLDDVLATTTGDDTLAMLKDLDNTTAGSGTAAGVTTSGVTHDPFGNRTGGTPSATDQWGGGRQDAAGLVDRRNRYYDPKLGTFISEDPLGPGGGTNMYGYVWQAPIGAVDPLGLSVRGDVSDFAAGALDGTFGDLPSKAFGADCWGTAHEVGKFAGAVASSAYGGAKVTEGIEYVVERQVSKKVAESAAVQMAAGAGGGAAGGAQETLETNPNASTSQVVQGMVSGAGGGFGGGALSFQAKAWTKDASEAMKDRAQIVNNVAEPTLSVTSSVAAGQADGQGPTRVPKVDKKKFC